jgi:hypothetical protein
MSEAPFENTLKFTPRWPTVAPSGALSPRRTRAAESGPTATVLDVDRLDVDGLDVPDGIAVLLD